MLNNCVIAHVRYVFIARTTNGAADHPHECHGPPGG